MLGYDLVGIITLILLIWGLVGVVQSSASPIEKLIWVLILIALPIIGFILWYFIGPGTKQFPLRR
jgi:hypothetical protein